MDSLHPGLKGEDRPRLHRPGCQPKRPTYSSSATAARARAARPRPATCPPARRLIDLSPDFRLAPADEGFVYGLPELNRRATCQALHTACPGPLATCVLLGLLPLAKNMLLGTDVTAFVLTAATETAETRPQAGRYDWAHGQRRRLPSLRPPRVREVTPRPAIHPAQLPVVGPPRPLPRQLRPGHLRHPADTHPRGPRRNRPPSTATTTPATPSPTSAPDPVDLKQVAGTNKCLLHLQKDGDRLLVTSAIDNLLKGSAGQAVHNMNLMFNLEETTGLRLKGHGFLRRDATILIR